MSYDLSEIKRRYEEKHVDESNLNFNVKVFAHNDNLGFQIIRKIDGFPLNCSFLITKEMLIGQDMESLADSLNMMFNSALLEMAYKIRRGLIK